MWLPPDLRLYLRLSLFWPHKSVQEEWILKYVKSALEFGVKDEKFTVFVVFSVGNFIRTVQAVPSEEIMFQEGNFDSPVNQVSLHHT